MCFLPHLSSLLACPQPRHLTSRLSFVHLSSCHLSHLINLSCLATSSRSLSVSLADVGIASVALGVMRNYPQRPYFDATGTNDRSHAVGSYVDALSRRPTRAPVLPFRSFAYDPPRSPLTVEISSSILDLALPLLSESVLIPPPHATNRSLVCHYRYSLLDVISTTAWNHARRMGYHLRSR